MPVELRKSDQMERIWVYTMIGKWTWKESFTQFEREAADPDFLRQRYDVIVDMAQTRDVPNSSLPNFNAMVRRRKELGGKLTVIVSANALLLILANSFRRLYALTESSIYIVRSHQEAYDLIGKDRA